MMTPNLAKLFAEKKNQQDCDEARELIVELFETHGLALVEALEEILEDCAAMGPTENWHRYTRAVQVLATLEREAGGER